MPAPITYQGVVAQDGGGGVVFKDYKFWVAQRIPNRLTYVQHIKNNGGNIVGLEKNADYLIADHFRQDAPQGSYSYEFIDHALETGSLDNADEYLCNSRAVRSGGASAPVSSSARPIATRWKDTKTPYTPQDDAILTEYVIKLERKGFGVSGNEIYKPFEAKHPHHTWKSWRDRWVKKLQHLPRPEVSDGEPSSPPGSPPARSTLGSSASQRGTPKASRGRAPSTKGTGEPRRRAKFTVEEDDILWQFVRQAAVDKRALNGNKIYEELAYDFPQHTFHSWRDRALKVVIPQHKDEIKILNIEAALGSKQSVLQLLGARREKSRENDASRLKDPLKEHRSSQSRGVASVKLAALQTAQRNASPASRSATETPIKAGNSRNHTSKLESRSPQQQQPQSSPKIKNEPQYDAVQGDDGYEPDNPPNPLPAASPTKLRNEELLAPKILEVGLQPQFYRDYSNFLEAEGVQAIPWPSVRGRAIELWDLWKAAISQKADPSERDWQQVAEVLGFDWIEDEAAPGEVRMCYENNLARFEEAMLSFQEYDSEEEEDDNDDEEEESDAGEAQNQIEEVEEPMPSSPPILSSLKRSFAAIDPPSDPAYPHSSPKRRRLDRNQEIPSTPDEMNGTSRLRRRTDVDMTPTKQPSTPQDRPSASRGQIQLVANNEDEEDELRDELQELPALPRPRGREPEPETQDFQFDPETQKFAIDEVEEDSCEETQDNITPSQQLRLESDMTYPEILPSSQHQEKETVQATTPTPRRKIKGPFQQDESDDETPRAIKAKGGSGSPTRSSPARQRRSLPKAWSQDTVGDVQPSMPSSSQQRQQQQSATLPPPPPRQRKSPSRSPEARTVRTATPVKETPDDIIDRFLSLGYTRAIVIRALKATTWHIGNAGQVMEILRRGEALPQRTSGVWTQRDDDGLMLVDSEVAPQDAKGETKRAKELRRLQAKHGAQGIQTRRQYLRA